MPDVPVSLTTWLTPSLHAATTGPTLNSPGSSMPTLMQWGPYIQFQVQPFNFHEYEHETQTSWARKLIAGAATYREWTGEDDEILILRGQMFPYRIGGFANLELLDALRRIGVAMPMMRGDGVVLGWFVMEKLHRTHHALSSEGIGQHIDFEATFARCPIPAAATAYSTSWLTTGMPNT